MRQDFVCYMCGHVHPAASRDDVRRRAAAMADSRILNWYAMDKTPPETYIAAREIEPGIWYFKRVTPAVNNLLWLGGTGYTPTHWARDILGLPFDG